MKLPLSSINRTALIAVALVSAGCALPTMNEMSRPAETVRRAVLSIPVEDTGRSFDTKNDYARFLGGLPGGRDQRFRSYRDTDAWRTHSSNMDALWKRFEDRRMQSIRSWRRSEIGDLARHPVVFYPFSGPDFLFADAFFPGANTYVLCGLEGADMLPDVHSLSPQQRDAALDGIYTSLTTALSYSFFITKDMRVDLQRTRMKGTLPLFMVFMARSGYSVDAVEPVQITPAGKVIARSAGAAAPGLKVRFRTRFGATKTLFYFQENLADSNLKSDRRLLKFVDGYGAPVTFVKSASYLMHGSSFSTVRNYIVNNSRAVLQDDSGIPLRHLDRKRWDLNFYGNYRATLDIFKGYYQSDLARVFREQGPEVHPMEFGIGYAFMQKDSSLIVARKR